ncbi:MAG: hypothetical protein LBP69_04720 [Treponema sp.]|jgi:predicted nucleic acid-binding protein|nr:hypothetical protein [Treponema sp.]
MPKPVFLDTNAVIHFVQALDMTKSSSFDFVDCLLTGYAKVKGCPVLTFDSGLKKALAGQAF